MVRNCCVCARKTSGGNGIKITLHGFPSDIERRNFWIKAVNRKNWQPTNHSVICSEHFEERCFEKIPYFDKRRKLKPDAVPTIFPTSRSTPQSQKVVSKISSSTGTKPSVRDSSSECSEDAEDLELQSDIFQSTEEDESEEEFEIQNVVKAENVSERPELPRILCDAWENSEYVDVTIICSNGAKVEAHRSVLASSSPFLKAVFLDQEEGCDSIISMPDSSIEDVLNLLQLMYSGQVSLTAESAVEVQSLCKALEIEPGNSVPITSGKSVSMVSAMKRKAHNHNLRDRSLSKKKRGERFSRDLITSLMKEDVKDVPVDVIMDEVGQDGPRGDFHTFSSSGSGYGFGTLFDENRPASSFPFRCQSCKKGFSSSKEHKFHAEFHSKLETIKKRTSNALSAPIAAKPKLPEIPAIEFEFKRMFGEGPVRSQEDTDVNVPALTEEENIGVPKEEEEDIEEKITKRRKRPTIIYTVRKVHPNGEEGLEWIEAGESDGAQSVADSVDRQDDVDLEDDLVEPCSPPESEITTTDAVMMEDFDEPHIPASEITTSVAGIVGQLENDSLSEEAEPAHRIFIPQIEVIETSDVPFDESEDHNAVIFSDIQACEAEYSETESESDGNSDSEQEFKPDVAVGESTPMPSTAAQARKGVLDILAGMTLPRLNTPRIRLSKTHTKTIYPCCYCAMICETRAARHEHLQTHDEKGECPECKQEVPTHELWKHVLDTHLPKNVIRPNVFQLSGPPTGAEALVAGMNLPVLHTPRVGKTPKRRIYPCCYCDLICGSREERETHLGTHDNKAKCPQCSEEFPSHELLKHVELHFRNVASNRPLTERKLCNTCGGMFMNLRKHINRKHKVGGRLEFQCKLCTEVVTFAKETELRSHSIEFHPESRIVCEDCGVSIFPFEERKHKHVHEQSRVRVACHICGKLVLRMSRHIAEVHEKRLRKSDRVRMDLQCELCAKVVYSAATLHRHMLACHNDTGGSVCLRCKVIFPSDEELKEHRKQAHPKKITNCELCLKPIPPHYVTKHLMEHAWDALKPDFTSENQFGKQYVQCPRCFESFTCTIHLANHTLGHLDPTRSFQCDGCFKCFKSAKRLEWHKDLKCKTPEDLRERGRVTRRKTKQKARAKRLSENPGLVVRGRRRKQAREENTFETGFACVLCEETFRSYSLCQDHMYLCHDNEYKEEVEVDECDYQEDIEVSE